MTSMYLRHVDSIGFKRLDDFDVSQTDHEDLMKVVILENDREPYKAEIRKDIHAMQSIVGGLIEPVYISRKTAMHFVSVMKNSCSMTLHRTES